MLLLKDVSRGVSHEYSILEFLLLLLIMLS